MKPISILSAAFLSVALAVPLLAQNAAPNDRPVPLPSPQDVVEGEAFFLERIAIPPDSKLFVSLVGRVAGAEYLPLASGIFPARNGSTPFRLLVPQGMAPVGPYRVQAWIVADGRLLMNGANPQTLVNSLSDKPRIRLKIVSAPQNIDGIGDGKPLTSQGQEAATTEAAAPYFVRGTVEKRDRRALSPDAQIEVTLSDVSLADAPSKVIGRQKFSINAKQLPVPFAVPIRISDVQQGRRYSLSVRIEEAGKLSYISDTVVPVTPSNVRTAFPISVVAAGGG